MEAVAFFVWKNKNNTAKYSAHSLIWNQLPHNQALSESTDQRLNYATLVEMTPKNIMFLDQKQGNVQYLST